MFKGMIPDVANDGPESLDACSEGAGIETGNIRWCLTAKGKLRITTVKGGLYRFLSMRKIGSDVFFSKIAFRAMGRITKCREELRSSSGRRW